MITWNLHRGNLIAVPLRMAPTSAAYIQVQV